MLRVTALSLALAHDSQLRHPLALAVSSLWGKKSLAMTHNGTTISLLATGQPQLQEVAGQHAPSAKRQLLPLHTGSASALALAAQKTEPAYLRPLPSKAWDWIASSRRLSSEARVEALPGGVAPARPAAPGCDEGGRRRARRARPTTRSKRGGRRGPRRRGAAPAARGPACATRVGAGEPAPSAAPAVAIAVASAAAARQKRPTASRGGPSAVPGRACRRRPRRAAAAASER